LACSSTAAASDTTGAATDVQLCFTCVSEVS
jgi:hypothetical protein